MQILDKHLVESLSYDKTSRISHPIFYEMQKLEVGQGIQVNKDEWDRKTPIGISVGNFSRRLEGKYQTRAITGGVGWMIIRVA